MNALTSTNVPCKHPDSCGVKTHLKGSAPAVACGKTRMATYDGSVSAAVGAGTAPTLTRPEPRAKPQLEQRYLSNQDTFQEGDEGWSNIGGWRPIGPNLIGFSCNDRLQYHTYRRISEVNSGG